MDICIVSKYPIIQAGLLTTLQEKSDSITTFLSLDNALSALEDNTELLLIYTLFKDTTKDIEDIVSIKNNYNNIKLLVIDFNQSKDMFFKLSKIKIEGYILGNFAKEDIEYAIHKISNGNRFYDRELLYNLVDLEDNPPVKESKATIDTLLTKREKEILFHLSNGLSNLEIASNLNISENTVKKHISNIFIKINVKDRTQATIYAYDVGLVNKPLIG